METEHSECLHQVESSTRSNEVPVAAAQTESSHGVNEGLVAQVESSSTSNEMLVAEVDSPHGNNETAQEDTFVSLTNFYEASKSYVDLALTADENGNKEMAIKHYMDGLKCLEEGTGMGLIGLNEEILPSAHRMQNEMLPILQQVRTRLYELEENIPEEVPSAPSFVDSSESDVSFEDSQTFSSQMITESDCANADEILKIPYGVQLFTVDNNCAVAAAPPSYPNCLTVYRFNDTQQSAHPTRPPAFLRVGDWVYPLMPGCSPVLHCANGAYVFPNISSDSSMSESHNVGVVLSADLDAVYEEMFRAILSNSASLQEQECRLEGEPEIDLRQTVPFPRVKEKESPKPPRSTSEKIASGIGTGADWISWGLSKSADLTVRAVKKGATGLQKRLKPNTTPASVSPVVERSLQITHQASKAGVVVSSAVVKGICVVANEIAKGVGNQLRPALPSPDPASGPSAKSRGLLVVAGAGLDGLGTIWNSLESSGMAIGRSVATATSETVQYKYGEQAGKSAGLAMNTAVNCAKTMIYLDNLGLKAIAKRTARKTGKEVLKDYSKKSSKTTLSSTVQHTESPSTSKQSLTSDTKKS